MEEMERNNKKKNSVWSPSKKYYIALIVEQLVTVLCLNIVVAYIAEYAVYTVEKHDIHYLYVSIMLVLGATIIALLILPFAQYAVGKYVKITITKLKQKCYEHTILMERSEYSKYHEGEIMSHFSDDIKEIEDLYTNKMRNLIGVFITGPISIIALINLNIYITLSVVVFGVLTLSITGICAKKNRVCSQKVQDAKSQESNKLLDTLNGLEDIRQLGITDVMNSIYKKTCSSLLKVTKKAGTIQAFMDGFSGFMYFFKQIVVISLGIYLVSCNRLSVGELVGSIYLLVSASYVFDNLGVFFTEVQKSLTCKERMERYLSLKEESPDDSDNTFIDPQTDQKILFHFENVNFGYDSDNMILKELNMNIMAGDYTAIVGSSGSGKSSIMKLLLRFYKESEGSISLYDKKMSEYSVQQIRNHCAFVPQEPYLFPGTIKENIRYGNYEASMEDIITAAKQALCHDFIMELPDGYDTVLNGETSLSGGQKQRISIARALLKHTSVLLLDEPTAALDAESEKNVLSTLDSLKHKLSIIVITHKLYSIHECDKVIMIEEGKIVEQGDYDAVCKTQSFQQLLMVDS